MANFWYEFTALDCCTYLREKISFVNSISLDEMADSKKERGATCIAPLE